MILTCPECATSYFVDDSRIPAGGRTVKCTSCGARWHTSQNAATSEPDSELFEDTAAAEPAPEPADEQAGPEPVTAADDLVVSGPAPGTRPPRVTPPTASKAPTGPILAWGLMAALVVAFVVGAVLFRDEVVRLAPQTSGAYAGLGLSVNSLGLAIEQVKVEPTFQAGRPVLAVSGTIRNLRDEAAEAPAIRIEMLSRSGKPLAAKIVRPIDPHIPAGAKRHFAVSIADPPSSLQNLELAFETGAGHARPAAVRAEAAAPQATHAPEPVEAQPLPADAPDALSEHHG
ncbi:DUF3426 domain-containing protein [Phenylobacterium sp.]|uniref:DUF3426 domain-containing protein n=1 Tax=Phenylobacterium sp. TaxID=1871053 RepID=UPI002B71FAFD|nr:DUF3426 domain-containing protein [Phenylobacterium sp.]HVI32687.1 DUF3426 domain-containing protein [Phenylobacterium sp.]